MGSIVGTNCATDWIQIPCATNTMDVMLQIGTPGKKRGEREGERGREREREGERGRD